MDADQSHDLSEGLVKRVNIGPLKITRIRRAGDLDVYRDAWRDLASGAPMRSPEWFLLWWQYYATSGDELCVLLFHEPGGLLVGLAPLYIHTSGKRATVRLLGSGDASTNHTTWLAAAGWEALVSRGVAQFLIDFKAGWDRLELEFVDADDQAVNASVTHFAEHGFLVRKIPRHSCWKIPLPTTWDEYLKMLSKTHRKRCRKLHREFLESGRVQVHRVESEADFSRGFEILLQLHAARWGEPAKPFGCFSDHRFRAFHEAVARELLSRKQLLLVWLEFNGNPVAVEYQFIDRKTVYSYQAGMDPSVTEFSPGQLSIMVSIQSAIVQHCEYFDLSRGNQQYKVNWRATPEACHDIRIWSAQLSGRIEHAVWGVRNLAECGRMLVVKGVKAVVPRNLLETRLRVLHFLGGKRRLPRQADRPGDGI